VELEIPFQGERLAALIRLRSYGAEICRIDGKGREFGDGESTYGVEIRTGSASAEVPCNEQAGWSIVLDDEVEALME
jgi:hypothetical protein